MTVHFGLDHGAPEGDHTATAQLVISGDTAYLIDMSAIKAKMFEMMPMTIEPPQPEFSRDIFFRAHADHLAPRLYDNRLLITTVYDPDPEYNFAFLFPLGRRAYVSRKARR